MSLCLRTSLAWLALVAGSMAACGGTPSPEPKSASGKEPRTAKEKQLMEAKAAGEVDDGDAKWGKWRYQGERTSCFFAVGSKCFKTQKAACSKLRCKGPAKCTGSGGGPVILSCSK